MGNEQAHLEAHSRPLPPRLGAPAGVLLWRDRMLKIGGGLLLVSLVFLFTGNPVTTDHFLRAWLLGFMMCFGAMGGSLVLLMLQYVSGGKWGLLLRRPFEAATRTLPLVALMFLPVGIFAKRLYLWAAVKNVAEAVKNGVINQSQAHAIDFKRPMMNLSSWWLRYVLYFAILGLIIFLLNKWSLDRDADPEAGTVGSFTRWRVRFENLSGPGILVFCIILTGASIDWIMSLDIGWYSTIYGLQFLVGQAYGALALGILTVILLSKAEPMRTILRKTEQYDLGKFAMAFVMLNIYLAFAAFLIIWSGNQPEEIPWYLNRIRGGWWYICTLDFVCHWVIPFTLLLSRDLKFNKTKMAALASWMLFARWVDLFWLIEPNFPDAARNLHFSVGIFAYLVVPAAMISLWAAYYLRQLKSRPLVNVNDPHLEEILEHEHVH